MPVRIVKTLTVAMSPPEGNSMNDWLTVREAAARAKVSRKTIYAAVAAQRLRASKFASGREIRLTPAWVDEWLASTATGGSASGHAAGELQKSA